MNVTATDHVNWRVGDVDASLRFYRDVLGLEPFGLERYRRGERPFFSVRVGPAFVLHLRPEAGSDPQTGSEGDHLALVVEGVGPERLRRELGEAGVGVERSSEGAIGARGRPCTCAIPTGTSSS